MKLGIVGLTRVTALDMARYGVCCNSIAPLARTRLTTDATPSTAGMMSAPSDDKDFDAFNPRNVAPLVAWLGSEDAKDTHGEVFRVGGGTVLLIGQPGAD